MTFKEALEYLRPIYENAQIYNYAVALGKAIEALEQAQQRSGRYGELVAKLRETKSESKRQMLDDAADAIEQLRGELEDERYRHDRYVDYAVKRDSMFDRLMEDLKLAAQRVGLCEVCRHGKEPLICEGADYVCDTCTHESCVCHACWDCDRFEWRGLPDHVESDTINAAGIDRVEEDA